MPFWYQSPVPGHIDELTKSKRLATKDVDGFTQNIGRLYANGKAGPIANTPRGIDDALRS